MVTLGNRLYTRWSYLFKTGCFNPFQQEAFSLYKDLSAEGILEQQGLIASLTEADDKKV